jgi:hypothetical protein
MGEIRMIQVFISLKMLLTLTKSEFLKFSIEKVHIFVTKVKEKQSFNTFNSMMTPRAYISIIFRDKIEANGQGESSIFYFYSQLLM